MCCIFMTSAVFAFPSLFAFFPFMSRRILLDFSAMSLHLETSLRMGNS